MQILYSSASSNPPITSLNQWLMYSDGSQALSYILVCNQAGFIQIETLIRASRFSRPSPSALTTNEFNQCANYVIWYI